MIDARERWLAVIGAALGIGAVQCAGESSTPPVVAALPVAVVYPSPTPFASVNAADAAAPSASAVASADASPPPEPPAPRPVCRVDAAARSKSYTTRYVSCLAAGCDPMCGDIEPPKGTGAVTLGPFVGVGRLADRDASVEQLASTAARGYAMMDHLPAQANGTLHVSIDAATGVVHGARIDCATLGAEPKLSIAAAIDGLTLEPCAPATGAPDIVLAIPISFSR